MAAMAQVSDFKPYTGDDDLTRADKSASRASLASADEAYSQAILLTCAAFTRLSSGCRHFHSGQPVKQCAASQAIPDLDEYTKEPPPLPPHLRHIILNKAPPVTDACALPTPHHVALALKGYEILSRSCSRAPPVGDTRDDGYFIVVKRRAPYATHDTSSSRHRLEKLKRPPSATRATVTL